jgi:anti-sigma factor RsiW
MTDKMCPQEDLELFLTIHGALPWPEQLQVQLHRLLCPACRRRYQELRQTSQELSVALTARASPASPLASRPAVPLWGAALACALALSAAAWAARVYLLPPALPAAKASDASFRPDPCDDTVEIKK